VRVSKIRRGMHRLGLALAAIPIGIAVGFVVATFIHDNSFFLLMALLYLSSVPILYGVCWGSGWVVAGFMGDEG
jgi:hypothetical protein